MDNIVFYILMIPPVIFVIAAVVSLLILPLYDFFMKTAHTCDIFDHHVASDDLGFDGCSPQSTCTRCKRKISLSSGGWFAS